MNKKTKLLFVDLDGTALDIKINGSPTLSKKNKQAIVQTRKKGIEIVISTGRIGWNANRLIEEIGGNYFILGNGSLVIDKKGKTIFEEKISKMDVIKIINFAQKNKLMIRPSLDYKVYGVSSFLKRFIVKNFGTEFVSGYTLDMTVNRHKILLMGSISKNRIERLKNDLNKKFKNLIAVTSAYGRIIEITSLGATKGLAAKFITDRLGIKKNQTAHIGDTMNDSTAKGFVGSLIAMKNADKKLKEIADYIGPHYKNGGLAKILEGKYQPNKLL